MSESYGPMVGCRDALMWVGNLKDVNKEIQERVLRRMAYEFDKDIPVPRRYNKGKYGKKYDTYSCGNCGAGVDEAVWSYCPVCGFRICKSDYEKKIREEFEQLTIFDYLKEGQGDEGVDSV